MEITPLSLSVKCREIATADFGAICHGHRPHPKRTCSGSCQDEIVVSIGRMSFAPLFLHVADTGELNFSTGNLQPRTRKTPILNGLSH
jgi:hypothetical protein